MPRPREFDETAALEAAMECFWRRGYEATSLRDLTASMGLTAPSLYNAFGDKQELFARALERYLDRTTRDRLRRLEESLPPKEALHRFFAEIVEHSIKDRQRKGCFLVNSALEVAPHDAECRAVIAEQFGEIEAFFKRCILAGPGRQDGLRLTSMPAISRGCCSACCSASACWREPNRTVMCSKVSCGRRLRCSISLAAKRE